MTKYLLSEEIKRVHDISVLLQEKLKQNNNSLDYIYKQFYNFIKDNRECSIEDILNNYFELFNNNMIDLVDEKYTNGMQIGIQNKTFSITGYKGKISNKNNSSLVNDKTYFSFDSISKILISILAMQEVRNGNLEFNTPLCNFYQDFDMQANLEDILKFTALIRTEKRIDNLSREETISILKKCRDNIEEKSKYKNFYQYNDIGYMILRQCIPDCLKKLDELLIKIDDENLIYKWNEHLTEVTGGRINQEFITPDLKGRDIYFPGHAGIYGNITGLLNLFQKFLYSKDILTSKEREKLFSQPYVESVVYDKEGNQARGKNNSLQYMSKVAGVYREPYGIDDPNYKKLASCDMSSLTTREAKSSAGTSGSWVIGDCLEYQGHFGNYVGGILSNPYSFVEVGDYPNARNEISGTKLEVNQRGVILGYQTILNANKELITEYGLLLELITEYLKLSNDYNLEDKKFVLSRKMN